MSRSHVQWTAPAPLWPSQTLDIELSLLQPALLRFASDDFMQELIALLENEPERLGELRATAETWRRPVQSLRPVAAVPRDTRALAQRRRLALGATAALVAPAGARAAGRQPQLADDGEPALPLKLYQPAHQRFYLIGACLVCREPGLPDRTLDLPNQERASFVVRRLRPPNDASATKVDPHNCAEYALVGSGPSANWIQIVDARETLIKGEEQHPLFPLTFVDTPGRRRRLLAGLVPVGRREIYMGARERSAAAEATATTAAATALGDAESKLREVRAQYDALLVNDIIEPWKQLIHRIDMRSKQIVEEAPPGLDPPEKLDHTDEYRQAREQAQTISWYILLDLANFLRRHLRPVWDAIIDPPQAGSLLGEPSALYKRLGEIVLPTTVSSALLNADVGTPYTSASIWPSLRAALKEIMDYDKQLDDVTARYNRKSPDALWPKKLFPLADPLGDGPLWGEPEDRVKPVEELRAQINKALQQIGPTNAVLPPLPLVARQALAPAGPAWFVIRCVFERPACGALCPALVSEPTEPFQIAAFFDPDAPARPIRIAMPLDISPGGLRKFDRNTAFVLSDMLKCQVEKLGGMSFGDLVRSVLPWPFHKDLPVDEKTCADGSAFGVICSISIPIITICALILLMIIVSLLDIIFHWIPYFILCLPLPGLKARQRPPE